MDPKLKNAYGEFKKKQKAKNGFLCIHCILNTAPVEILQQFIVQQDFPISTENLTKDRIIQEILSQYSTKEMEKRAKDKNMDLVDFLGNNLCHSEKFECELTRYDFIAQSDLVNVFADYCADQKINVFKPMVNNEYLMNLYLTKKDPTLKTEAVFILNGIDTARKYQEIFLQIERSGEIADWKVFVTTPVGAMKIGYDRLINDMERLNCWVYIVDPLQTQIFGILKGNKSKRKDLEKQSQFIESLPSEPIRAPSQVKKISKYHFSEKESYKPKKFQLFYINEEHADWLNEPIREQGKYQNIFQTLLLIANDTGLTLYSKSIAEKQVDEQLISGYLSALDSFVGEVSGQQGILKEIDYKNFKINSAIGKQVKLIVITTQTADLAFTERIEYFLRLFEETFQEPIKQFIRTGNQSAFDYEILESLAEEILLI